MKLTFLLARDVPVALSVRVALRPTESEYWIDPAPRNASLVFRLVTVTVNEHVDMLPDGSVAVQVTVVVPTWKFEHDGGEQLSVALQLSETGTVKQTMAVFFPRSVTVIMFPGQ